MKTRTLGSKASMLIINLFVVSILSLSPLKVESADDVCLGISPYKFQNTTTHLGPGFGDPWNKYAWSMKFWKNQLYVGTNNAHFDLSQLSEDIIGSLDPENPFGIFSKIKSQTRGAQIWRYNLLFRNWQQVTPPGINSSGFRKMLVMGDKLIVSSTNITTRAAELWHTTDGRNWQKMSGGPTLNPSNNSFRSLAVYNGKLYVGSDNFTGAELWSWDGSSWTQVKKFTLLDAVGVSELAVLNDLLYVGTQVGGFSSVPAAFKVYTINSVDLMTDITPAGVVDGKDLTPLGNIGVAKLFPYRGRMFMGTANFIEGFTLMAYNPSIPEWKVISIDGFGVPRNTYTWSMAQWDGKLFLGTFNSSFVDAYLNSNGNLLANIPLEGAAQLWSSQDGFTNWKQVSMPKKCGWGIWDYGIRNMEVANDFLGRSILFMGSASNLFAPDAGELINLVGGSSAIWNLIPQNTQLTDKVLAPIIGPGTEIWAVQKGMLGM